MKKRLLTSAIGLYCTLFTPSTFAQLTLGDAQSSLGEINISATARANYQHKNYGEPASDQKIKFDAAILRLDYQSADWFGQLEYRCYQYDEFCDFSTLVTGYMGYRLNATDHLQLGIQPVPFGPDRFWDSSFYAGINNTMGLQDVSNLGLKYHFNVNPSTQIDLAYFNTDGGNYHGTSQDAARYSANIVQSSDPLRTQLQEQNMWMARINHQVQFKDHDDLKFSLGASYWFSDIENQVTKHKGEKNVWATFARINYHNLNFVLTGGKQTLQHDDRVNPNSVLMGSFDSEYDVANTGYFYTVDTHYPLKQKIKEFSITPYLVLSGFKKSQQQYADSQRNILGVAWNYKQLSLYSEYIWSKNDPFIGGNSQSLARGDDGEWNKLFNLMMIYNF